MSLGYIGSKKSLKDFLVNSLNNHIDLTKKHTFVDLFAGTGFVGNFFSKEYNFDITSNDLEYYSYVINYSYLKCSYTEKIQNIIDRINNRVYDIKYKDLIKKTYTPFEDNERMFFTIKNGDMIDYSICVIQHLFDTKIINEEEMFFLKGSLITSIDKVANTASVYGAYLKKFKKTSLKDLVIKPIHKDTIKTNNEVLNEDSTKLELKSDIGYMDPPYNTRQYSSNYFLLNYILKYDESIEIKGKTGVIKNWNRSSFCSKKTIKESVLQTITKNNFDILMFSYNNEGLLTKEELTELFKTKYTTVHLYEKEYKKFKSQKNNNKKNTIEYLFINIL